MPLFSCIPLGCRGGVDIIDRIQCGLEEVPPEVDRSAHTLEELYLDCNQISEINEKLARCRKLRTLSLGQNKLLRVPSFIGLLKTLEELHLEDNELTDLPAELEDCSNLQVLDLRLNLFLRLPDVVPRLESLTQLHLFETSLTQLPADIGCLRNLRYLDVRENQLRVLPPAVCDLTNLKQLDVGRNELLLLPMGLGILENLEELYADHNLLNAIPDSLVSCLMLKVLDISENDILTLPEELGDLTELCELNISENRITSLPSSMSRLKKLATFKADSNGIAILTTAIGGCVSLHEMYLANNQLTSVPSALGNLEALTLLTLDENRLTEIPSTIGGCRKLSILTLRNNQLQDLPFEIGRLENLNVLDLCDNQLMFLPYTITVLTNLKALWLSVDQTVPRVPLTVALDPVTHVKVLTCYLLPQGMGQEAATRQRRTDGNVHFGEDGEDEGDDDSEQNRFIRRGTPHPKPRSRVALRRQSIDGHFIPHNKEENKLDQTLLLRRKSMGDTPNPTIAKLSSADEFPAKNFFESSEKNTTAHQESPEEPLSSEKDYDKSRLKEHCVTIKRDEKSGFGLTMAGGCDSEEFKKGDNGLFITKVLEGGAAEEAGLCTGDKIVSVNGASVVNAKHKVAADLMQKQDPLILVIVREQLSASLPIFGEAQELCETEDNEKTDGHIETVSTTVQRDMDGSLGFRFEVVASGIEKLLVVSSVKGDGTKLRIGDRIVSINGTNVSSMNVEDAEKILVEDGGKEAYLIVQRKNALRSATTSGNNISIAQDDVVPEPEQNNNLSIPEPFSPIISNNVTDEKQQNHSVAEESTSNQEEQQTEEVKPFLNGRKAPPVAPKPKGYKILNNSVQQGGNEDVPNVPEPSALTFSSKLKKFESVSQVPSPRNTDSNGLPAKKPLISQDDILRLKEDAGKRAASVAETLPSPDDSVNGSTFDEFIEKRASARTLPSVVRTKKAELRMERASPVLSENSENGEELTTDLEKRQQWRQARYKSLEVGAARADSVMEQVREIKSRSGVIPEEPSSSPMSSNGDVTNNNGEKSFTDPADDCAGRLLNGSTTNAATLGVSS